MSLTAIRAGLKCNIEPYFDGYTVLEYEHKSPPAHAIVVGWPDHYDPRPVQGTGDDLVIPVRFEIPWQDDESSNLALEDAMDAAVTAIESDRTLGGACDDLSCAPFIDIGARTMPSDAVIITFTVPVEVIV
jgi:hypothetical protein